MAYSAGLSQGYFKVNLGLLFLKVSTLGLIILSELDWITNHQTEFSRLDLALVIKIVFLWILERLKSIIDYLLSFR